MSIKSTTQLLLTLVAVLSTSACSVAIPDGVLDALSKSASKTEAGAQGPNGKAPGPQQPNNGPQQPGVQPGGPQPGGPFPQQQPPQQQPPQQQPGGQFAIPQPGGQPMMQPPMQPGPQQPGAPMPGAPVPAGQQAPVPIQPASLPMADFAAILDQHQAVSNVKSLRVLDDTRLLAGGAATAIAFQGTGTNFGTGATKTYLGVYDAQYTSDPASGGVRKVGAIGGAPTFTSATDGSVTINPAGLAAGSYWLRCKTQLADGSWEVAEGALLVH
jgi:hypothetical protein